MAQQTYMPCPFCGGDLESFGSSEVVCQGTCQRHLDRCQVNLKCRECKDRSRHFLVLRFQRVHERQFGSKAYVCLCDACYAKVQETGTYQDDPCVVEDHVPISDSITKVGQPVGAFGSRANEVVIRGQKRRVIRKGDTFS